MNDRHPESHARQSTLARLLAEALRSRSGSGDANASPCPDAEILATYAEHGLSEEEANLWEIHFADCDHCQKIIAVLTASDEELVGSEAERLGAIAVASGPRVSATPPTTGRATPPATREAASRVEVRRKRPTIWYWLAPAFGVVSVVALWFALHPTPPKPVLSARGIEVPALSPSAGVAGSPTPLAAITSGTQAAEPNLTPSSPPVAPEALDREPASAGNHSPVAAQAEPSQTQEALQGAAQARPESEVTPAAPTAGTATREAPAPPGQGGRVRKAESNDAPTASSAANPAPAPPASATPAAASPASAPPNSNVVSGFSNAKGLGAGAASGSFARNQVNALAKAMTPLIVFGAPGGSTLWRVGPAGRIEHSDKGQTWRAQSSGVMADLLAGAASSDRVAWAVGRAGTIVRTTDGESWQQVSPPPGPATDWVAVEAGDAQHASITSRDLRRFATEDGGRTWVQQK